MKAPRPAASLLLLALGVAACAPRGTRAGRTAPLSPDSAAALERAVRLARPAYATQEEALRAGAYLAAPEPARAEAPVELPGDAPRPPALLGSPAPAGDPAERPAFVIQIAAYRDRASAEIAARDAARAFPDLESLVEEGNGYFRVALSGWRTAAEAEAPLARVREAYPGAWVRARTVP